MEEYEYEEDFAEILAHIYEATCGDCFEDQPHHLCCNSFFCDEHFLAHSHLFHPERFNK